MKKHNKINSKIKSLRQKMDLIKNNNIYKVSNRYKKLSHNKPIKIIKKTKKVFFKVIPKHKINKINKVYNIIYQKI